MLSQSIDTELDLTSEQSEAVLAAFRLGAAAPGNSNEGSVVWTYQIADSALDFLGAGETVTVTSTVEIDDGHAGGTDTLDVSVVLHGSNDAPTVNALNEGSEISVIDPDLSITATTLVRAADGGFLVVWNQPVDGGDGQGIMARRFSADGAPLDDAFTVNDDAGDQVLNPSGGNAALFGEQVFVVYQQSAGGNYDVYGQLFHPEFGVEDAPISISIATGGTNQIQPKVIAVENGDLLVYWSVPDGGDADVVGKILHHDGQQWVVGNEFLISQDNSGYNSEASLTLLDNDHILAVWQHAQGGSQEIQARTFEVEDTAASGFSTPFTVNTETADLQSLPTVATLYDGSVVVTWSSTGNDIDDNSGYGVFGQRFQADGVTPMGEEFHISTTTSGDQLRSTVTPLENDGFAVAWEDTSNHEVNAQRFDYDGVKIGGELQLNQNSEPNQLGPDIVGLAGGGFAAVYRSAELEPGR